MILVTGGTGFIGSHLLDRLVAENKPVRALVHRQRLPRHVCIEQSRGDLVSGEGLEQALKDVDTVIHLAGVTKALSADAYYAGNVRASENLARAIARTGRAIRLVHVSSLAAIGPGKDRVPVSEETPPQPLTHYGKSKLQGERIVRGILPNAMIVRPPVVYGPRDTDVFELLKSISRGFVVQLAGGERWFSAIYACDLVTGILAAAASPVTGRSWFLAHPKAVSWTEFGEAAARIMNRTPRLIQVPRSVANAAGYCAELWARLTRHPGIVSREKVIEAECRYWICDTRRASEEIGFHAVTGIDEGLAITLSWYREAGWLKY
jgi:nucleoside-diphosphate-sugar epimerase